MLTNTEGPKPSSFQAWLACIRPKTLGIAIAPVAVGLGTALAVTQTINVLVAVCTLFLSILMQVISNMENDAGYTKRKAERSTRKGLPRATANGWLSVNQVEWAIRALIGVVLLDTIYLIYVGGWIMLFISLSSVAAAYLYMGGPKPIAYTPFGEFVVFIFFGLVAVCGTYYLQTASISLEVFALSSALGLIAAAVLLVNNYRDLEHDQEVGRKTLAVCLGSNTCIGIYRTMLWLPLLIVTATSVLNPTIAGTLLVWLLLPKIQRLSRDLAQLRGLDLNGVMFRTVQLELLFSLLLTIGTVLSWVYTKF